MVCRARQSAAERQAKEGVCGGFRCFRFICRLVCARLDAREERGGGCAERMSYFLVRSGGFNIYLLDSDFYSLSC